MMIRYFALSVMVVAFIWMPATAQVGSEASSGDSDQLADTLPDTYWDSLIQEQPNNPEYRLKRGLCRLAHQKFGDAKSDLDEAIRLDCNCADAYNGRGLLAYELGELKAACDDFNRALRLNPKFAAAYANRGQSYRSKGQIRRALDDLDLAILLAPASPEYHFMRGTVNREAGDLNGSLADFNEAIRLDGKLTGRYLAARALTWFDKGNWQSAVKDLDIAISSCGTDPSYFQTRGAAWCKLGDPARGIADLGVGIELAPQAPVGYRLRAEALEEAGKLSQALADCDKALALGDTSESASFCRGLVLLRLSRYEQAAEEFTVGMPGDSVRSARFLLYRARAYYSLGKVDEALKDLDESIRHDPKQEVAYTWRAVVLHRKRDFAASLLNSDLALLVNPDISHARYVRGKSLFALSRHKEAFVEFDEMIRRDPKCPHGYLGRGDLLMESGTYQRGYEDYAEALRLGPEFAEIQDRSAWIRATCPDESLRDGPLALKLATRACEMSNWRDGEFVLTLATAHAEVGEFDKAKERLQQSIVLGLRGSAVIQNDLKKSFDSRIPYRAKQSTAERPITTLDADIPPSPAP
jgi:tetratricopeptide (TPR) repeat protein